MHDDVAIDADRFRERFEAYSRIGATDDDGLHRLALSDADREARDRFVGDLEDAGLAVRVDEIGNVFGRYDAGDPDAAPVLVGSHLDSQPYGGRFDGQLGVLTALEAVQSIAESPVEPDRPIEVVNWTNEEGSRFQPSMLGSAGYVGHEPVDDLLAATDRDGNAVGDELERIGYDGDAPCEPPEAGVDSYLELHVEQGPVLDDRDLPVAVVDGVYGLAWLRITIDGQANHAGPTPMHGRSDALVAASDAISEINRLPQQLSADAVATVGEFDVEPNSVNVIPSTATFTVDTRSYDDDVVENAVERIEAEVAAAADRHGADADVDRLSRHHSMAFSDRVRDAADRAVEAAGVDATHLVSGAGHDAQHLQSITDAGMLFVPSVDGITHSEEEYTEWDDCVAGARAFTHTTLELATE
ncbi:MAG: Zn-dependent hydrolase [Halobacterium sp.]